MAVIPYGRQEVTKADIDAVVEVLRSDYLTQGPAVPAFEAALSAYCDAGHAVATNNATAALHLACLAAGLGPGDWLWTSPITFIASATCGLMCGAKVDFVDIDPRTYNLSPAALEAKLAQAERTGRLPKVVVPVHLGGQACEMQAIHALAERYGFRVIEDASHAVGGSYGNRRVGSCQYSDATVFSFHPVKIITTGEGGMALTGGEAFASKLALLRSHGVTRDAEAMTRAPDGPWYYQQLALGFNYRMTDFQAALGLSQLDRLDAYVARRQALARGYDRLLADLPVVTPWQHPDSVSAFHLYIVRLRTDLIEVSHRQVFEALRGRGIGVNIHYIPLHTQPYFQALGFRDGDFPEAERYYGEAITLPLYATLSDDDQAFVVEALRQALR